jgi:beta-alanine degradation protein BauB
MSRPTTVRMFTPRRTTFIVHVNPFGDELMSFPRSIAAASALCFLAGAGAMWAQQQVQGGSRREPQFENDQVSAWKSIVMPRQPLALHRHDHGRALVALTDGRLDVVDKNGKILTSYDLKTGKAIWLGVDPPGQMHADVNPGTKPLEVIVVQLKHDR